MGRFPPGKHLMGDAVTDTHGLIWFLEDSPLLGSEAGKTFDACDKGEITIYVPTICLVEILYLQEKGRIPIDSRSQLEVALKTDPGNLVLVDLTVHVVNAMGDVPRSEAPDMPDRINTTVRGSGHSACAQLPAAVRTRRERYVKLAQGRTQPHTQHETDSRTGISFSRMLCSASVSAQ